MAGKIVADQIEHSTAGSLDTSYVVNCSAKAWVNFNGTGTVAIRDSLSVSGVTDNGTGDYTVTVSSAFGNANYCCGSTAQQSDTSGGRGDFFLGLHQTAQTTTTRRVSICDSGGTPNDGLIGNLQIWGDLA